MKKLLPYLVVLAILIGAQILTTANAQTAFTVQPISPFSYGAASGTTPVAVPVVSSTIFRLPALGSVSKPCVIINDASGTFATQTCGSGGGSASTTIIVGVNGITVTQVGANATATLDTTFSASWSAIETFLKGVVINGTTTLASTTNCSIVKTDSSGNVGCGSAVLSVVSSSQIAASAGTGSGISFSLLQSYLTAAITSINGNTNAAQTFTAGSGISVVSAGGNTTTTNTGVLSIASSTGIGLTGNTGNVTVSNTGVTSFGGMTGALTTNASTGIAITNGNGIHSIQNIGVTSFTGQGCVTAANSTGSVALTVSCISGNQTITFVISGDATGTASGATSITDSITVTGLNGKVLPANTTGTLQFSGNAWSINLATSSLGVYNAAGALSSYLGSSCGGGQFVTGFSATGTVACGTPSGAGTVTSVSGANSIVATPNPITGAGTVSLASSTASGTIFIGTGNGQWAIALPTSTSPLTWTYASGSLSLACATCLTGNQSITLSQDASGSGSTAITVTVKGLQTRAVTSTAPTDHQLLAYIAANSDWEPANIAAGTGIGFATSTASSTSFTISNTGVTSVNGLTGAITNIATGTAVGGSCTSCNLSYSNGLITVAANGSGGSGGNNATGSVGYAAYFSGVNNLASSTLYGSSTFAIGTTTLISGYSLNAVGSNPTSTGGTQIGVQNTASTSFSQFTATADIGTTSTNYMGVGINNSNNSSTGENPFDTYHEGTNGLDLEPCVTGATSSQCVLRVLIGGLLAQNIKMTITTSSVQLGSSTFLNIPALSNALALISSTGTILQFGGSNCAAGSLATGFSATGTAACVTTSTVLTGVSTSTGANPTQSIDGASHNGTANTFMRSDGIPGFAATVNGTNLNLTGTLGVSSTITQAGGANSIASTTVNGNTTSTSLAVTGVSNLNSTTTVGTGANQFTVNPTNVKSYVVAGSSTTASTVGGTLAFSATSTGNGAAASTSLMTYSLPTSTYLTIGDEIDIFIGGTFANSVNTNKQIQISIASTTVFDTGVSFAPANVACNWFAESRGMASKVIPTTNPATTTIIWATQFTDSCTSALTDDSGDAGNATVTATTTAPINITVYGNGTGASDVVANYFRVFYAPF